jgi:hypothetical protein
MKKKLFNMLASLVIFSMSPFTYANGSTMMTATEKNLHATINVTDAGKTSDGKRTIAYRVVLHSQSCDSVFSGIAAYFSNTDDAGGDSAYLPNGYAVQINTFKDRTAKGNIEMFMDVEFKRPRYVYFSVTNVVPIVGGCVPAQGIGIGFYSKDAYSHQNEDD